MLDKEDKCPCNSGRLDRECCFLPEPMITLRTSSSINGNLRSDIIAETPFGQHRLKFRPNGFSVSMRVRKMEQLDGEIEEIVWAVYDADDLVVKRPAGTEPRDTLFVLSDALHAVRYHERNFFYRYRKLQAENAVNPHIVQMNGPVAVELDDMPLRYEFESFLYRIFTTLDVLEKLSGIALGKNFDLSDYLSAPSNKKRPHQAKLKSIYVQVDWLKPLKTIRNELTHYGFWKAYKPMKYESGVVSPPLVGDTLAPFLVAKMWRDLLVLIHGFLTELFPASL